MTDLGRAIVPIIIGLLLFILLAAGLPMLLKIGENPLGTEGEDPGGIEAIKELLDIEKDELEEKIRNKEMSAGEAIVSAAVKYTGCKYTKDSSADLRNCELPQGQACPLPNCQFQCGDLVKKAMYDAGIWKNPTGEPMSAGDLIGAGKTICSPRRVSANKYDLSSETFSLGETQLSTIASHESELKQGDLFSVTYKDTNKPGHAGIYIGDGKIIHAFNSVRIQDMSDFFDNELKDKVQSVTFCRVLA